MFADTPHAETGVYEGLGVEGIRDGYQCVD